MTKEVENKITNDCAIKEYNDWCEHNFSDFFKPSHSVLVKMGNALKKAEEYKWHDLRKNINDLPKNNTMVFVHCKDGIELKVNYYNGFNCHDDCTTYKFNDVIAWKYIDSFKEEED